MYIVRRKLYVPMGILSCARAVLCDDLIVERWNCFFAMAEGYVSIGAFLRYRYCFKINFSR